LHPLADGRLGQADGAGDGGVTPPPVLLQLFDDQLGTGIQASAGVADAAVATVVEPGRAGRAGCGCAYVQGAALGASHRLPALSSELVWILMQQRLSVKRNDGFILP
jgi:hypothetical protein